MKILLAAVVAGTLATAAFNPAEKSLGPGVDPIVTGVVGAASGRYLVANAALDKVCFLSRGPAGDGGSSITAERACETVWPGLSRVTVMKEDEDGTFVLQGRLGRPVLKLAAGDGVAFEAIAPRRALITLSPAD